MDIVWKVTYFKVSYDDPVNKNYDVSRVAEINSLKDYVDFLTYLPHATPSYFFKDEKKKKYRYIFY